jgi:biopolymer transport protein ExbD
MTPNLAWWGTLAGLLAVQAAALTALGAAAEVRVRAPQGRRALWQAVLLAVALVWVAEIIGLPGKVKLTVLRTEALPALRASLLPAPSATGLPASAGTEENHRFHGLSQMGKDRARSTSTTAEDQPAPVITSDEWVEEEFPAEPTVGEPSSATPPPIPVKWPGWIWLCGAAVLFLRSALAQGCLALHCRRRVGAGAETETLVARLRRPLGLGRVSLQVWPGLRGPIAFGLWWPTVALPADFASRFTPAQREAMLAHELAHLAARDPFWLALADAILALAWWHPAVWWARRRLRVAGEAAADEASALVPSGPAALAESLVLFGRELASPGLTRALGVAGSGFRSDLARRVSALLGHSGSWRKLSACRQWSPRAVALGIAAVVAVAPVRAGFSGSVLDALTLPASKEVVKTPERSQQFASSTNREDKASKNAATVLKMAQVTTRTPDTVTDIPEFKAENVSSYEMLQEGKVLLNARKLDEAEVLFKAALEIYPRNTAAAYYLDIVKESRYKMRIASRKTGTVQSIEEAESAPVTPTFQEGLPVTNGAARTNVLYVTSPARHAIKAKLDGIRLNEVSFDGLPLAEVLKKLTDEAVKRDPDHVGIKFMIDSKRNSPPATTDPVAPPPAPLDLGTVRIKINPPLREIKLVNVLDAICMVADQPITFDIEDYAVVFIPKPQGAATLIMRTFKVNLTNFVQGLRALPAMNTEGDAETLWDSVRKEVLRRVSPQKFADGSYEVVSQTGGGILNTNQAIAHGVLRKHLERLCINLDSPKAVFFNERAGLIAVNATEEDIAVIQEAINRLNAPFSATPLVVNPPPEPDVRFPLPAASVADKNPAPDARFSLPTVTLQVRFTELPEQSPGDLGLDWLFGRSPTNNPTPRTGPAADLLEVTSLQHAENYRVDALRTEGESATLSEAQFQMLIHTLEQREGIDVLCSPQMKAFSGRPAFFSIRNSRTVVSAAQATDASPTNKSQASASYLTETVGVGPMLEVTPVAEGGAWRLTALAGITEFLGYDQPKKGEEVVSMSGPGKPLYNVKPLPHFRALEARASALLASGQTLALRGPSFGETNKVKGGLFHKDKTEIARKRLYMFVTVLPETPGTRARGEVSAPNVVPGLGPLWISTSRIDLVVGIAKAAPYLSVGPKSMTIKELRSMIEAEVGQNPDLVVQIRLDGAAPSEEVLKVLQTAKDAGVAPPNFRILDERRIEDLIVGIGKAPPYLSIGSKSMTIEQLRSTMRAEVADNPDLVVQIRPDRGAPLSEVLGVMKAAKDANVKVAPNLLVLPEKN